MIDIHAHILPRLDDGSDAAATSLRMARLALQSGVTEMIATPHSNQHGRFENFASPKLWARFQDLQARMRQEGVDLRLHLGMEVFATPDVAERFQSGMLLTLAQSRYLLIEFAFTDSTAYMSSILRELLSAGVTPVVAHPERYRALQDVPDYACDWVKSGVHLQINQGSLFGSFGSASRTLALQLLEHDLVSFCASDAHGADRRTPAMQETRRWISARYGAHTARRLLHDNPVQILRDLPLQSCSPIPFR